MKKKVESFTTFFFYFRKFNVDGKMYSGDNINIHIDKRVMTISALTRSVEIRIYVILLSFLPI